MTASLRLPIVGALVLGLAAAPLAAAQAEELSGPAAAAAARARANAGGATATAAAPAAAAVIPATVAKADEPAGPAAAAAARARAMRGDPLTTATIPEKKPRKKVARKTPRNWQQALAKLQEQRGAVPGTAQAAVPADDVSEKSETIKVDGKSRRVALKKGKAPAPMEPITDQFSIFGGISAEEPLTDKGLPVISADNVGMQKAAIAKYEAIVAAGGWPTIPALQMEVGTSHPAVAALRKRLQAEGDLEGGSVFGGDEYFGMDVEAALRRFQARNGLAVTGNLLDKDRAKNGSRSVTALNVSAKSRLAQLKGNLGRIQAGAKWASGNRYVIVNLPDQEVQAVENGRVVLRLAGVVGRPERPSPALTSTIHEVKFNPTWNMPPTVLKEDFLPKAKELQSKGQNLLVKAGIDAIDGSGRKMDPTKVNFLNGSAMSYRYVQPPGGDNPLGFAKLEFASPEAVYMHDTPSSKLFSKAYRAASSGCIRVENMEKLVRWLLKDTDGWSAQRVGQMKETGESMVQRLNKGVPLQWVYITAWADTSGTVHFRRDIYGRDQSLGVDKLAAAY